MAKSLVPLIAVAFSLMGCATQIGQRNSSDQRLTMFSQIVFAPDFDSRRTDYLAKWASPIKVAMRDRDTSFIQAHRGTVATRLEAISDLTGLKAQIVGEASAANVTVYLDSLSGITQFATTFARNKSAPSNIQSTGCHSEFDRNANHEITSARVFIRTERTVPGALTATSNLVTEANRENDKRIERCMALEFIRILGLRNASDIVTPSIFNTSRNVETTTVLDLKFIRTLYNPQLKPGMERTAAIRVADGLLKK